MTGKTFKELDVKPGDKVSAVQEYEVWVNSVGEYCDAHDERPLTGDLPIWSIVSRATDAPVMTLPNGDILREGDYAKLRNGEVVGPLWYEGINATYPWVLDGLNYTSQGAFWSDGHTASDADIIAKATNPRTAKAVAQLDDTPKLWRDMTADEKGALLLAHHEGKTIENACPTEPDYWYATTPWWSDDFMYRIKPKVKRETVTLWKRSGLGFCEVGTIVYEDGKPDPASIKMNEVE